MKLTRLEIQQLPGIEPGFVLTDLQPGINVVTGPNAIGKSSLIRALRYLVAEPATGDPAALSVTADFDNGGHWRISRTGHGYQWTCNGVSTERPALPDREALHCYWLTMENLAIDGDDDRQLVDQLRQALSGGYDLPALRKNLFNPGTKAGQRESKDHADALQRQRNVEASYRQLQQQAARLPELDRQIERASLAATQARNLQQALELLDNVAERREIEAVLAQFPTNMDRLNGGELARFETLEKKSASLEENRRANQVTCQSARTRLQQTNLADAHPQVAELDNCEAVLADARLKQERLNGKHEELNQAQAEQARALNALGGNLEPPKLQPELISSAEQLADALKQAQLACQECEARLQGIEAEDVPDAQLISRHLQAEKALVTWLVANGRNVVKFPRLGPLFASAGGLLALLAAWIDQTLWALAAGVIVLVGVILSFRWPNQDGAAEAQAEFEAQNLPGPATWEHETVSRALEALRSESARLYFAQQQALTAKNERTRLQQLQQKLQTLEEKKQALSEQIGFNPSLTAQGVNHFALQVRDYHIASEKCQAIEVTTSELANEIATAINDIHQFLRRWNVDAQADLTSLQSSLSHLADMARQAEDEKRTIAAAEREITRLSQELEATTQEIAALYRNAGLEPGAHRELQESSELLDAWGKQRERMHNADLRIAAERQALAGTPELIERAEAGDREGLQRELEKARALAGERDDLFRESSDIRSDIRNAGSNRALEQATAEVEHARNKLEERLDEQLFAEAGQFLLDEVESEHRSEHEPAVLRDARERFGRFTHHAWDIELHDGELKARDLRQDLLKNLEELSSGTRMQLLLAVRLAWTRRLEQSHVALPLFLDEALTTSDEKRFAAVAKSLVELARSEGRQIIYLSARRQELDLWERATGERPHHINLPEVRGMAQEAAAADYEVTVEPPLPEPGDKSPQAYAAELGVPPVTPTLSAGHIHLFHLLRDDLALLYQLLQLWNVRTLGQLESLLRSSSATKAVADTDRRQQLLGRCRTATTWVDIWRRGRGKPVDRIALEASGAVTDKFIDEVTALAERCDADATRLLEGLDNREVARFQTQKIDELREFFTTEGYTSPEPPLDAEGRERAVLLEAGRDVDPDEIRQVVAWLEATAPQDAAPVNAAAETL